MDYIDIFQSDCSHCHDLLHLDVDKEGVDWLKGAQELFNEIILNKVTDRAAVDDRLFSLKEKIPSSMEERGHSITHLFLRCLLLTPLIQSTDQSSLPNVACLTKDELLTLVDSLHVDRPEALLQLLSTIPELWIFLKERSFGGPYDQELVHLLFQEGVLPPGNLGTHCDVIPMIHGLMYLQIDRAKKGKIELFLEKIARFEIFNDGVFNGKNWWEVLPFTFAPFPKLRQQMNRYLNDQYKILDFLLHEPHGTVVAATVGDQVDYLPYALIYKRDMLPDLLQKSLQPLIATESEAIYEQFHTFLFLDKQKIALKSGSVQIYDAFLLGGHIKEFLISWPGFQIDQFTFLRPILERIITHYFAFVVTRWINSPYLLDYLVQQQGEVYAYCGRHEHAVNCFLHKGMTGNYSITVYNTGEGLEYHPRFDEESSHRQTFLSVDGIPSSLIEEGGFFHRLTLLQDAKTMDSFYKWFIDEVAATGRPLPPSTDPEDYERQQEEDSCALQALMSFFRHQLMEHSDHLPKDERLALYKLVKNELLLFIAQRSDLDEDDRYALRLQKLEEHSRLLSFALDKESYEIMVTSALACAKNLHLSDVEETIHAHVLLPEENSVISRYARLRSLVSTLIPLLEEYKGVEDTLNRHELFAQSLFLDSYRRTILRRFIDDLWKKSDQLKAEQLAYEVAHSPFCTNLASRLPYCEALGRELAARVSFEIRDGTEFGLLFGDEAHSFLRTLFQDRFAIQSDRIASFLGETMAHHYGNEREEKGLIYELLEERFNGVV